MENSIYYDRFAINDNCIFRKQLIESLAFSKIIKNSTENNTNILRTLLKYKVGVFKILSIASFLCVHIYICNIYFLGLMRTHLGYEHNDSMLIMLIVQGMVTILIPVFSLVAECVGYLKVLKISIPVIGMMGVSLFMGANIQFHSTIIFSLVLYVFGNSAVSACIFKYMFDILPAEVRCTGCSFIYSIAAAIFGGTDLMVAALSADHGSISISVIYVLMFAILAYVSVFHIHDKNIK